MMDRWSADRWRSRPLQHWLLYALLIARYRAGGLTSYVRARLGRGTEAGRPYHQRIVDGVVAGAGAMVIESPQDRQQLLEICAPEERLRRVAQHLAAKLAEIQPVQGILPN